MGICNIPVTFDNCDNLANIVPISRKPSSAFVHPTIYIP